MFLIKLFLIGGNPKHQYHKLQRKGGITQRILLCSQPQVSGELEKVNEHEIQTLTLVYSYLHANLTTQPGSLQLSVLLVHDFGQLGINYICLNTNVHIKIRQSSNTANQPCYLLHKYPAQDTCLISSLLVKCLILLSLYLPIHLPTHCGQKQNR